MNVWVVKISNCESTDIIAICTTKEIAERELFKERDRLIDEWKKAKISEAEFYSKFIEEKAKEGVYFGFKFNEENSYDKMISALSNNDYEKWDNYPHEQPFLYETTILDI